MPNWSWRTVVVFLSTLAVLLDADTPSTSSVGTSITTFTTDSTQKGTVTVGSSTTDGTTSNTHHFDPSHRPPQIPTCFSGVSIGSAGNSSGTFLAGEFIACAGPCANLTFVFDSMPVNVFFCDAPYDVCTTFEMEDKCDRLRHQYPDLTLCCCDPSSPPQNCNVQRFTPTGTPPPVPYPPSNITCYEGITFDSSVRRSNGSNIPNQSVGVWRSCFGACFNITIGAFGTLRSCDPVSVCDALNLTRGACKKVDQMLTGCCCDDASGCSGGPAEDETTTPSTSDGGHGGGGGAGNGTTVAPKGSSQIGASLVLQQIAILLVVLVSYAGTPST